MFRKNTKRPTDEEFLYTCLLELLCKFRCHKAIPEIFMCIMTWPMVCIILIFLIGKSIVNIHRKYQNYIFSLNDNCVSNDKHVLVYKALWSAPVVGCLPFYFLYCSFACKPIAYYHNCEGDCGVRILGFAGIQNERLVCEWVENHPKFWLHTRWDDCCSDHMTPGKI